MRTVLLVPRRAHPERDKLWTWAKARWQAILPDVAIFEGHHDDGPFNRSAAVNTAARLAGDWDVGIVIDGDIFLRRSQVLAAIESAATTGRVTWAHRRWRGIREDFTKRIVADRRDFGPEVEGTDMDVLVERTNPISWSCCIAIPRAVFDAVGGFDERFRGWGFEDMAFQSLICGLYGHERIEGDVYHLWHARTKDGSGRAAKDRSGYTADAITNARLGRRYMVALRRDHRLHDRGDLPSDPAELARDIANLQRDDGELDIVARSLHLPDWSEWWPTLDELNAGWKAQAAGTVTVVVHSGGSDDTWNERTAYLVESLASLEANLQGAVVQRVVYSDWPRGRNPALEALVEPFGYYVAGEGNLGYTGSRRALWTYLSRRAKGDYIFSTEDDFVYDQPVDLAAMAGILRSDPDLAQLALLRDAYYQAERDKGGILGWDRASFRQVGQNGDARLEHRLFFTANPSLFRKTLTHRPWPTGPSSERLFGDALVRGSATRFAFLGTGTPAVRHIGAVRAGGGY